MIPRARPTWLEIDSAAIAGNIGSLRACLTGGAQLMAVVKADAYGHGALAASRIALENGAVALGVAIPEEGAQLREAGIGAPILILGGIAQEGAEVAARYGLAQTVFDPQAVRWLAEAAGRAQTSIDVHIKVDTGMGRIGVRNEAELLALAELIAAKPGLRLAGVYTHFAEADAEDLAYTLAQNERFLAMTAQLRLRMPGIAVHAANSAATLRVPQAHHTLVRPGIALYGGLGLRPAMRWVTHAVHVKTISPGESVSYGRTFRAGRETRVMTLPVGYADGYHRQIGNRGAAVIRGMRAPVIGRVCMDQAMLDVTDIPGAAAGDEVVLLGDGITAAEMGNWCGMVDYEIMLSPTARVPRVYL